MPRVVGIYLPVPADQKLVNQIISNLSNGGIEWDPYIDVSTKTETGKQKPLPETPVESGKK